MVVDSWSRAFHANTAICVTADCYIAQHHHRIHTGLSIFGHPGVCTGADSRKNRNNIRFVLRICIWHGRSRLGSTGHIGRPHQPRIHVPGVLVPSLAGTAHCIPSAFTGKQEAAEGRLMRQNITDPANELRKMIAECRPIFLGDHICIK